MRIALQELLRQPGRFVPVGVALTLLVVLLVVLGGFLDGLELNQTGAYRAHDNRLLVFADDADLQLQRSRITGDTAQDVEAVAGVGTVGWLSQAASTASPASTAAEPGEDAQIQDVIVFGYDQSTDTIPAPPGDRGAVVDAVLADLIGIQSGDTVVLGPSAEEVTVSQIVGDLTQGAPTVWLSTADWRAVIGASDPTALPREQTTQALVVTPADGNTSGLAERIDTQVEGVSAATPEQVIGALDVVQSQSSTFRGIIGVTFAVTLLVVALFFALITLERVGLYSVLKAIGARTSDLLLGISIQAVVISVVALLVGIAASLAFVAVLPADLPVRLLPSRLGLIAVGTVVTALIGSLFTLRRILSIDPAEAIG